jgi:alcohol dehydrogenase class IV
MRGREPEAIAAFAAALGVPIDDVVGKVADLGGVPSLEALGVDPDGLAAVADAALGRPELRAMTPPPGRDELLSLLQRAYRG